MSKENLRFATDVIKTIVEMFLAVAYGGFVIASIYGVALETTSMWPYLVFGSFVGAIATLAIIGGILND